MNTRKNELSHLINEIKNIRNVCILAHVDHGKTSLADSLLATNGLISTRLAGKLRYMDSKMEEQERGITMKSSAVALLYENEEEKFLINLIDSPGHIDFASEVSTAVRLCDGAIVVVDVVEGVCPQTRAVLRQAWEEKLKPILVLNKLDRLILERGMSPEAAHKHITHVIQSVNCVTAELFAAEIMAKNAATSASEKKNEMESSGESVDSDKPLFYDWSSGLESADDEHLYFAPEKGNVVFASAWDTWGFRVSDFARLYAAKLGCKEEVLCRTLWGDYYLVAGSKNGEEGKPRILRGAIAKGKKPLFVSMILEQMWNLYRVIVEESDSKRTAEIVAKLGLRVSQRDLRQADKRAVLRTVSGQWLPVGRAVLGAVAEKCPSPAEVTQEKVERLLCRPGQDFGSLSERVAAVKDAFLACSSSKEAPTIAFVSKIFAVDHTDVVKEYSPLTQDELAQRRDGARKAYAELQGKKADLNGETTENAVEDEEPTTTDTIAEDDPAVDEEENGFVAFARIFSGWIRPGQKVFVLAPKFNPEEVPPDLRVSPDSLPLGPVAGLSHVTVACVSQVLQFLGRELHPLIQGMPAGNVVGLTGLCGHITKSATLASTLACPAFTAMFSAGAPMVCVSVELVTSSTREMNHFEHQLRVLERSDPCLRVRIKSGETLLYSAGEVHLQLCLDELRKKIPVGADLQVSPFIVPFRETILAPTGKILPPIDPDDPQTDAPIVQENSVVTVTHLPNKPGLRLCVRMVARPLPQPIVDFIEEHALTIKWLVKTAKRKTASTSTQEDPAVTKFESDLANVVSEVGGDWHRLMERVWSLGPELCGPNLLVNELDNFVTRPPWRVAKEENLERDSTASWCRWKGSYVQAVMNGFELATSTGPLCGEPMHGVAFMLQAMWEEEVNKQEESKVSDTAGDAASVTESVTLKATLSDLEEDQLASTTGQMTTSIAKACKQAFEGSPMQRLVLAMYAVTLLVRTESLGRAYAVLGRRHGQVLSEEMREGEDVFSVTASIPVTESFGLPGELLSRSSGSAVAQLGATSWAVLDIDPLTAPSEDVDEGKEEYARVQRYIKEVRRRKGLAVREQLVERAEKQRTLSKKK